jgi:uncharacterized spore protein YtfJ
MIDYVVGGEFMNVTSNKGATPYINTGSPITGMVSFDGSSQTMKVYDGSGWQTIGGGSAMVNLTPNAISILKWAEKKMFEEYERERLAETNPTIKDLIDQIKQKEEQIKVVQTLIKEEEKIATR